MTIYPSSTAVMARRVEPADSLDFFPTPPWGTRALTHRVLPLLDLPPALTSGSAWDPCCGQGHMALALAEHFSRAEASDIHDYGFGKVHDFLHPDFLWRPADWIVMNPPFNRASEFVDKALKLARTGVAMLVRLAFLESEGRYEDLFLPHRPQLVAQFVERVPMHKGRWVVNGKTATAYCWLVWKVHPSHDDRRVGTRFNWIAPCRAELSRHDDWLTYGGCWDLKKTHPAIRLQDDPDFELPPAPGTVNDVAAQLQGMLAV